MWFLFEDEKILPWKSKLSWPRGHFGLKFDLTKTFPSSTPVRLPKYAQKTDSDWSISSLDNYIITKQKEEGRGGRGETRTCANSRPATAGIGANGIAMVNRVAWKENCCLIGTVQTVAGTLSQFESRGRVSGTKMTRLRGVVQDEDGYFTVSVSKVLKLKVPSRSGVFFPGTFPCPVSTYTCAEAVLAWRWMVC